MPCSDPRERAESEELANLHELNLKYLRLLKEHHLAVEKLFERAIVEGSIPADLRDEFYEERRKYAKEMGYDS